MKKNKNLKFILSLFTGLITLSLMISLTSCCGFFNVADRSNGLRTSNTDENSKSPDVTILPQHQDNSDTDTNELNPPETRNLVFTINYIFNIPGNTSRIDFITVIPDDYEDRQKISSIDYSISPDRTFNDGSNKYAEFMILNPASGFELTITTRIEIYDYDLDRAIILKKDKTPDEDLSRYVIEEKYLEVNDPLIQDLDVVNIYTEYPLEHVKMNYDYVMENMDYTIYNPDDVGAVKALKNKGGDCTDYTDVFVTLCRASGFPARPIEGYPIDANEISIGHNWSEVFIDGYGWIPFDPTYDDNNGSSQNTTFENLKNTYIYMSNIRNDNTLNNFHFYYYTYWGDSVNVKKEVYLSMN